MKFCSKCGKKHDGKCGKKMMANNKPAPKPAPKPNPSKPSIKG